MTRYQLQQFEYGYRMYDTRFEEPEPGEIARFQVNMEEAEKIEGGAPFYVWEGEIVFEYIPEQVEMVVE